MFLIPAVAGRGISCVFCQALVVQGKVLVCSCISGLSTNESIQSIRFLPVCFLSKPFCAYQVMLESTSYNAC